MSRFLRLVMLTATAAAAASSCGAPRLASVNGVEVPGVQIIVNR